MDTVKQVQILIKGDCLPHTANNLRKGIDLTILPPSMGNRRANWYGNWSWRKKTLISNSLYSA